MRCSIILLFLPFIFLSINKVYAQKEHSMAHIHCDTTHFHYTDYADSLSHFIQRMGNKKELKTNDKRLQTAFYVALSRYPELHQKKITLRLKSIPSTMQAQPDASFLLKRRENRGYHIFVNNNPEPTGIDYRELSFNALVGWLGHEFAHLIDYSSMKNRELLGFVAAYVFDKGETRRTERKADRETIKRGLGLQLLDGAHFFHRSKKVSKKYRKKNKKYYLTEEEIIANIKKNCN